MEEKKTILKLIEKDKIIIRLLFFFAAVFIVSLNYNLILVKNNLVIGGMSGLAIVIKELTGLSPTIFLYLSTVVLTIISLIFLDKKTTLKTLFGSLTYNVMVTLSAPLAKYIALDFSSTFILLLFTAVAHGICYGLIYRSSYNTGGSDTIATIISRYAKLPMGTSAAWTNIFIIITGLIVFGITKTIYAVFILLVSNKLADMIILGVKDSKMCYVKSEHSERILTKLLNNVNIGATELVGKGGIFTKTTPVLLIIVPTKQYYGFKHLIKSIDSKAFILTSNCHNVSGGYKKKLIPF
ncbi:MAG: YitT family protein [Bacilli bacterium]|nr:YitT family protein [Bacilli bacterium]